MPSEQVMTLMPVTKQPDTAMGWRTVGKGRASEAAPRELVQMKEAARKRARHTAEATANAVVRLAAAKIDGAALGMPP